MERNGGYSHYTIVLCEMWRCIYANSFIDVASF